MCAGHAYVLVPVTRGVSLECARVINALDMWRSVPAYIDCECGCGSVTSSVSMSADFDLRCVNRRRCRSCNVIVSSSSVLISTYESTWSYKSDILSSMSSSSLTVLFKPFLSRNCVYNWAKHSSNSLTVEAASFHFAKLVLSLFTAQLSVSHAHYQLPSTVGEFTLTYNLLQLFERKVHRIPMEEFQAAGVAYQEAHGKRTKQSDSGKQIKAQGSSADMLAVSVEDAVSKLSKLPLGDRKAWAIKENLYLNCLKIGHRAGQCYSRSKCNKCEPYRVFSAGQTVSPHGTGFVVHPTNGKTWVANRVVAIQQVAREHQVMWRHCPGAENPADIVSRGCQAKNLESSEWRHGPKWLVQDEDTWPVSPTEVTKTQESQKEIRALVVDCFRPQVIEWERFSHWRRLLGLVQRILRWNDFKKQKVELTDTAEIAIVRLVQQELYPQEYELLRERKSIPRTSSLLQLSPFLDEHGLLRVGGRLQESRFAL